MHASFALVRRTRISSSTLLLFVGIALGCCTSACAGDQDAGNAEQATPDSEVALVSSDPLKQLKERLVQLGAARWHAAGFRGQGIKIAILDSGFRGYRAHLGHALPAQVAVRSFRGDANLEAKN